MKRIYGIIAVMVLILSLFAVPLMAGIAYPIKIDGIQLQSDIMWKDNHVYVPIRLVAENMNCDVEWKNGQVAITTAAIHRPIITGDAPFASMVNQALDLLQSKDPSGYAMICQNVKMIERRNENKKGREFVIAESYGHFILIYPSFYNDSKRFVPQYLAGALVHEGSHRCYSKVCTVATNDLVKDERAAYMREIATLWIVGAPQWMIDDAEYNMNNWQTVREKF